jgi:hypothetical protein
MGPALAGASLLVLAVVVAAPTRSHDVSALREEYVRALRSYESVPYVWGGESRRGIDCSGLVRCGMIAAAKSHGLATLNPGLLRESFLLRWNDSSAKALKEEHRSKTRLLFMARSLNETRHEALRPGDMAVTSNGVHVLAYLGERTWIEADPSELNGNRVITLTVPSRSAWFNTPVHLVRWRQLDEESRA